MTVLGDLGEERVIALFARGDPPAELVVPNGDDAAAFRPREGAAVVLTTDSLVEEVHFVLPPDDPGAEAARAVGRKLMAVNLSDIAAMGARPRYALLAPSFPASTPVEVATAIADGIHAQAARYRVAIVGGNVSGSPGSIVLAATLVGEAPPDGLVRRAGARVGDAIYVSGHLGDARAGLALLTGGGPDVAEAHRRALERAQTDPEPRVAEGLALAATGRVHAMCDVSDGLARDLARLLGPDRRGARIEAARLPISSALDAFARAAGIDPIAEAVAGGEDYELLLTAPPEAEAELGQACRGAGTSLTRVGTITDGGRLELVGVDGGISDLSGGFDHFRAGA